MNQEHMSITRRSFMGAAGLASLALAACGGSSADTAAETPAADGPITGTYAIHVQGYDWGAGVDKATLTLDTALTAVTPEDFSVIEHHQTTDWAAEGFPVIEADLPRTVTGATLSDDGKTVELELACAPNDGDSPLLFCMQTQFNTWSDPYYLVITAAEGSSIGELSIEQAYTERTTSADAWALDSFTASDGTVYPYAAFTPEQESKTLVVWLHGMGEGGTENTDPYVNILANRVVALSEDEFQETVGGAHVVAPQCPTCWMDNDGKMGNVAENGAGIVADGTSYYTASLEEFLDDYAAKVGAEKVVLTGASNGGYMTMLLSLSRPDAYACVVPICEPVPDKLLTDEQIESLKDLPMYFVYSEDDTTVPPAEHEVPTIERLRKSGKSADTLHVSTTEHVIDTSGTFTDEEGNPYQYAGHWSWIYFDNNECECDEDGMKAFDFIAENIK